VVTTKEGVMILTSAEEGKEQSWAARCVRIKNVKPGDEVAVVARIN